MTRPFFPEISFGVTQNSSAPTFQLTTCHNSGHEMAGNLVATNLQEIACAVDRYDR
jgi:hypothetical protein